HDGGTIGQSAFLRVVPGQDVAVALLTNGGNTIAAYTEIFRYLLAELAGIDLPARPVPPAELSRFDASRYAGTYSCDIGDLTVSQDDDGRVWLDQVPKGAIAEMVGQAKRHELVRFDGDTLISVQPEHGIHMPYVFVGEDGRGRALYIHYGRAMRRASAA